MDVITESELAKHYEVHNLWVSIRGKVYDVSSYVDDHPGGVEVLKDVAGSDGTESFEYVGHSEDAYKTLAKFQIGVLEGEVCYDNSKCLSEWPADFRCRRAKRRRSLPKHGMFKEHSFKVLH
ncbi:cytochrome b5 [Colletotrichum kahawae]|uniref:Cytochrome b5 n=1 Tax=Colletotrichum kahawae TaxID=34407 RepID=A0AAD9YL27_COLKA|nr:cytochrome b5 [Colletotrichum kahawae]